MSDTCPCIIIIIKNRFQPTIVVSYSFYKHLISSIKGDARGRCACTFGLQLIVAPCSHPGILMCMCIKDSFLGFLLLV